MNKFLRAILLASIFYIGNHALFSDAFAGDLKPKKAGDPWTFSAVLENDLFTGDDDNYTNGVRFSWLSPETLTPHWLENVAEETPFFDVMGEKRISYSLGQNIYTPENVFSKTVVRNQRPYAGFLYGSAGLISDTGSKLERLEVTMGVVGPSSLAYETQKEIHKFRDMMVPKGWDNQLKDEPGLMIAYEKAWRNYAGFGIMDYGVDFTPKTGVVIGNVLTNTSIGATVRFGKDLPSDYGPPKIRPRMPGSDYFTLKEGNSWGWYLFGDIEGRAVARDIFLDGNTWKNSHHVDKENFVADAQAGAALTYKNYRLAYTHVFRTKEFEQQTNDIETFGGITLSIKY